MENKKVLLRLSNLKQYFPLKKRGLFVKANDGITLDIYEGETFGLVGESGCGKSTLGRTLLQLYRQTDGRSMYYGRSIDEIAPVYYRKTLVQVNKLTNKFTQAKARRDKVNAELDAIAKHEATAGEAELSAVQREKFAKMNEQSKAEKEANDAMLDLANVIGGFLTVKDKKPAIDLFLKKHEQSLRLRDATRKRNLIARDKEDLIYKAAKLKKEELSTQSTEAKLVSVTKKLADAEKNIASIKARIADIERSISELRKPYANNAEFQRYEAHLDTGIDLARLSYNEMRLLRSDMQLIFQDPYSSLNPRMTVGQIIGESLIAHELFRRNDGRMQQKVLSVMDSCGLAPYFLHRYPHQFSGGQRQRIGIARALAVGPKFVVCDEAVSALDVSIQSQIINLLQDLKESQNLTYMFITHDLSVVKYISDRIGVMYLGNMVELASSEEIFKNPVHPYTVALLNAIPTTEVRKDLIILEGDIPSPVNPPKGCKFHTRCEYCTDICRQVVPAWEEVAPNHFVACHHKLNVGTITGAICRAVEEKV